MSKINLDAGERKRRIDEAARFLESEWSDGQCLYKDDGHIHRCRSEDQMLKLYDLLHDPSKEVSSSAYSRWRRWISENPEDGK